MNLTKSIEIKNARVLFERQYEHGDKKYELVETIEQWPSKDCRFMWHREVGATSIWEVGGLDSKAIGALLEALSARDQRIADCEELLREIRDDEVNAEDEADKFLRGVKSSELSKARERIVTLESTIATTKSERDNVAKERDAANILLKRLMCIVVPDNVVPSDMKEFVRDSAKTVLKDLWEYLKTDADLRKAEHDTR